MTTTTKLPGVKFYPPDDKTEVRLVTRRRSSWYEVDGVKHQRVTTVLNKGIPKPALVPWARNEALASVRAAMVSNREQFMAGGESPESYMDWVESTIAKARARPDAIKDEAADWGTRAHACIATMLREGTMDGVTPEFQPAVDGFLAWQSQQGITVLDVERTVWDRGLHVAGTCDGVGLDPEGKLVVWDNKTGKAIYPEMALQVASYAVMLGNLTLTPSWDRRAWILRLPHLPPGPGEPALEAREVKNVGASWKLFLDAHALSSGLDGPIWKEKEA